MKKSIIRMSILLVVLLTGCGDKGNGKITTVDTRPEISDISSYTLSSEINDIDELSFRVLNNDLEKDYKYNECRLDPTLSADYYLIGSWTDDGVNYEDYRLVDRKDENFIDCYGDSYFGVIDNSIYYAASGKVARSLYYIADGVGKLDQEDFDNDQTNNYDEVNSLLLDCKLNDIKITKVIDCVVSQAEGIKKLVANVSLSYDTNYNGIIVLLEDSERQGIYIAGRKMGNFNELEEEELIQGVHFTDTKAAILTSYGYSQVEIDTNGVKVQFNASDMFNLDYTLSPGMVERSENKEEYWGINEYLGEVMAYTCIGLPDNFPRDYIMQAYKNCFDDLSELEMGKGTVTDKSGNKWVRHVFYENEYAIADGAILYVLDKGSYVCYLSVLTNETKSWTCKDALLDLADQMIESITISPGDSKVYNGYSDSVQNLYDLYGSTPEDNTRDKKDTSTTSKQVTGKVKKSK